MSEPTYRQALSHAWQLVWRNKILWIFGIFSAFLGQFGVADFVGQTWLLTEKKLSAISWFFYVSDGATLTQKLNLLWLGGIMAGVAVLVAVAAVLARGSLILSAIQLYKNKAEPSLAKLWDKSADFFWRLLALSILGKLLLGAVAITLAYLTVYFLKTESLGGFWYLLLVSSAGIFLALIISTVTIYASCYAVEGGQKLGAALKKGWHLFCDHLLVSVELSLILAVLNLALVAVMAVGATLVFLPSLLLWLLAAATGWPVLAGLALLLSIFLMIALIIISGGVFNAFTTGAWTYLFMKMRHEGILSHTLRYFKNFFRR